ncbi:GNAT family N-acetyltransferase [Patescibacteria group bacterium]|nr:GNAT family N-acetyltransferase [Patescibacteria group bacterium]
MKNFIGIPKRFNVFLKSYWLAKPEIGLRRVILIYFLLLGLLGLDLALGKNFLRIVVFLVGLSFTVNFLRKIWKHGFYHRRHPRDLLGNRVEVIEHFAFKKGKLRPRKIVNPLAYQKIFRTKKDRKVLFRYPSENDFRSYCRFVNRIVKEDVLIEVKSKYTLEKAHNKVLKKMARVREKKGIEVFVFYEGRVVGEGFISRRGGKQSHVGVITYAVDRDFRREGIAYQLNGELIRLSEKTLSLKLLIASVVVSNPVIKIFEKYGFKQRGVTPRQFYHRGKYLEMITFYLEL